MKNSSISNFINFLRGNCCYDLSRSFTVFSQRVALFLQISSQPPKLVTVNGLSRMHGLPRAIHGPSCFREQEAAKGGGGRGEVGKRRNAKRNGILGFERIRSGGLGFVYSRYAFCRSSIRRCRSI